MITIILHDRPALHQSASEECLLSLYQYNTNLNRPIRLVFKILYLIGIGIFHFESQDSYFILVSVFNLRELTTFSRERGK